MSLAPTCIAAVCSCRDDTKDDKLRAGRYTSVRGSNGRLMVEPGKSHTTRMSAEVPGLDAEPSGDWRDWVSPGYSMWCWLECLRYISGGCVDDMDFLFPEIDADGRPLSADASPDAFQSTIRGWAEEVGLPLQFCGTAHPSWFPERWMQQPMQWRHQRWGIAGGSDAPRALAQLVF